jgi:phosphocarrier protein HPr
VLERHVIVAIEEGLHARPAALFVTLAAGLPAAVTIRTADGSPVPTSSILSVMTLGARRGDEVVLASHDDTAGPSLDALVAYLENAG